MKELSTLTKTQWLAKQGRAGISLIDHLYNRIDGLYPQKFRSSFPDSKSLENWKEAWAEGFDEDKVTPKEIKRGLRNSRKMYEWPPSFKEFFDACRTRDDVPDEDNLINYKTNYTAPSAAERLVRIEQLKEIAKHMRTRTLTTHLAGEIVNRFQHEVNLVRSDPAYAADVLEMHATKSEDVPEIDLNRMFA